MSEEKSFPKTSINWYPGHMAKTKREITEKLDLIDIVYEVIDARMPKSSKIVDIDDLIKNKPRILIMTKYDLCDKSETDKFISYYESLGYHIPKRKDKHGRIVTPIGTKIMVKVEDLKKGSNVSVKCTCDKCGRELIWRYKNYNKYVKENGETYCNKCSMDLGKLKKNKII